MQGGDDVKLLVFCFPPPHHKQNFQTPASNRVNNEEFKDLVEDEYMCKMKRCFLRI